MQPDPHPAAALRSVETKAFVPCRDFELSQRFYRDLGFELDWATPEMACLRHGTSAFLLQNFFVAAHAENFQMHWLVEDLDAWWQHVNDSGLLQRYGVRAEAPTTQPWGLRDMVLFDPSGVLWRIAEHPARADA